MTASGRPAELLAEAINFAMSQPANIDGNEMIVRPTEQGACFGTAAFQDSAFPSRNVPLLQRSRQARDSVQQWGDHPEGPHASLFRSILIEEVCNRLANQ